MSEQIIAEHFRYLDPAHPASMNVARSGVLRKTETSEPGSLSWAPDRATSCLSAGKICTEIKSSRLFVQLSSRLLTVYFL